MYRAPGLQAPATMTPNSQNRPARTQHRLIVRLCAFLPALLIALTLGSFVATRPVSAQTKNVNIVDFAFSQATITINVGDSLTWTNTGTFSHSATSDTAGLFDTTVLAPAQVSSPITFNTPGTFTYHCSV